MRSNKKFSRAIENFRCENCNECIEGNGYTNHCPHCLYSKHVDINPGDRMEECLGLMKPIFRTFNKKKILTIVHKCTKCGAIRKNKISVLDNESQINNLPFH